MPKGQPSLDLSLAPLDPKPNSAVKRKGLHAGTGSHEQPILVHPNPAVPLPAGVLLSSPGKEQEHSSHLQGLDCTNGRGVARCCLGSAGPPVPRGKHPAPSFSPELSLPSPWGQELVLPPVRQTSGHGAPRTHRRHTLPLDHLTAKVSGAVAQDTQFHSPDKTSSTQPIVLHPPVDSLSTAACQDPAGRAFGDAEKAYDVGWVSQKTRRHVYQGPNPQAAEAAAFASGYRAQGETLDAAAHGQRLPALQHASHGIKAKRRRHSLDGKGHSVLSQYEHIVGYMYDPVADLVRLGGAPGGADGVQGPGSTVDLGQAPLPLMAPGVYSRTIGRKSLLLKVPVVTNEFQVELPAAVLDSAGHQCLIILPSNKPASRHEALALETLLAESLRDSRSAVNRACAWRAHALQTLCSDAIAALNEGLFGGRLGPRPLGQSWLFSATSGTPPVATGNNSSATTGSAVPAKSDKVFASKHDLVQILHDELQASHKPKEKGLANPQTLGNSDASQEHVATAMSIALVTTICMADAIRQVEIQCGERGRVLTYIWNAYLTTHENSMHALRGENEALRETNAQLVAQANLLESQVASMEYLRREIVRFRKDANCAEEESSNILRDNLYYQHLVEETLSALRTVESTVTSKLARLRWQHAYHVLGTRTRQMLLVSGNLGPSGEPATLVNKVAMLDRLRSVVLAAKRRKESHGLRRTAAEYTQGQTFNEVVKAALHQRHHNQWASGIQEESPENILIMLAGLQPDAQVVVLAALPEAKRKAVLQLMPAEQRAAILVLMSESMRQWTRDAIGKAAWRETMQCIQTNPELAAKMLHVVEMYEAVLEFSNWSTDQQIQALTAMDSAGDYHTTGQLIRRLPVNMRKDLLCRLDPAMAARLLQGLEPAGYISDCLDGVAELAKVRILSKMVPDKAAAVMVQSGVDIAAEHLVFMEDEAARHSILAHMPPKFAAAVLVVMDELAYELKARRRRLERELAEDQGAAALAAYEELLEQEAQAKRALTDATTAVAEAALSRADADAGVGDPEEPAGSRQDKLGSQALLEMESGAAVSIMGHMDFRDKVDMLSNLDSQQISTMMARMDPTDALALLATMSGTSTRVMAEALTKEDRERLLKALGGVDTAVKSKAKKGGGKKGKAVSVNHAKKEQIGEVFDAEYDKLMMCDDDSVAGSRQPSLSGAGDPSAGFPSMQVPMSGSPYLRESLRRHSLTGSGDSFRRRTSYQGGGSELALDLVWTGDAGEQSSTPTQRQSAPSGGAPAGHTMSRMRSNLGRASHAGSPTPHMTIAVPTEDVLWEEDGEGIMPRDTLDMQTPAGSGKKGVKGKARRPMAGLRIETEEDWGTDEGGEEGDERGGELAALDEDVPTSPSPKNAAATPKGGRGGATPRGGRGGARAPRQSVMGRQSMASGGEKVSINLDGDDKRKLLSRAMKAGLKNAPEGQAAIKAAKARLEASASAEDAWNMALEEQTDAGGASEPQGKLGKLPKNQRLKDAMAQHRNAKPKPKGWLITVLDQVYKDADIIVKKLGRVEAMRKQSVPEVVFAYFHNKYGQKNVVNEYVGSLVNTLTLYKSTDLRLELFAKFLSEEWDFATFLDFLTAQSMLIQPAKVVCIDYPKDPARDEPYAWACLYKCVWVADTLIGNRAKPVRDKFNEFAQEASTQVDESEVEKVRRDKRYEGEFIPDRFYKLSRPKFMLLLCKELNRINAFIAKMADDKFTRLDVQRTGQIAVSSIPQYLSQMLPPGTTQGTINEVQQGFLQFADAMERDVPATDVVVDEVKAVSRDPFTQATVHAPAIREYVKMALLPPPRPDDDDDEAELYKTYLVSVVHRHLHHMMPFFRRWLSADGKDILVQEQVMTVGRERAGDTKFKAYLNLLAAMLNTQVSGFVEMVQDTMDSDQMTSQQLEEQLSRIEDVVCIMLTKDKYLMACETDLQLARVKRVPIGVRHALLCDTCKAGSQFKASQLSAGGYVLQSLWRSRQKHMQLTGVKPDASVRASRPATGAGGTVAPVLASDSEPALTPPSQAIGITNTSDQKQRITQEQVMPDEEAQEHAPAKDTSEESDKQPRLS